MSVLNLYSKQQKASKTRRLRYRHDVFPVALRTQVFGIFERVFGRGNLFSPGDAASEIYHEVERILCHEYGIHSLESSDDAHALTRALIVGGTVKHFFRSASVEHALDVIQVTLTVAKTVLQSDKVVRQADQKMSLEDGIVELNARFKEHGLGYQFQDGQILKLTSEFAYENAVRPALQLLRQAYLAGANQEFLSAQDHFRHSRYKECLNDCLKAFESTMKAICTKRLWPYQQTDTAKTLIKVCEDNKLFPVFLDSHLTGLRTTLESGVPTARNKTSAHGQGAAINTLSEGFATYVLNLTAANILFLADCERRLK